MDRRTIRYLAVSAILTILLISACSIKGSNQKLSIKKMNMETEQLRTKTYTQLGQNPENGKSPEKAEMQAPAASGSLTVLPWENDENFKSAKMANNTPVLMGAYCTVLKDPLPGEEYNVHLAARIISGTVVKPGQVFSQNQTAGPYVESKGYQKGPTYIGSNVSTTIGGGVCKIASTLYNVSVLSNLQIIERHAHSMPVPYVPYGQDATVAYGARDFKFKNDKDFPVMIWAQGIENTLYIGFYGAQVSPKVEWHHETLEIRKASTIYKNNPSLPAGTEKRVLDGMDGARVKSWITIQYADGTTKQMQMGISSYQPMSGIVEKGG